jgi:hypothetical protein
MKIALAVGVLAALLAGAEPPKRTARPAWLQDGIVMAGNWEPEIFLRRRGGASVADLTGARAERSEAAARKLKEAGVTLVVTNFHKGFGFAAEAEDIESARRFVEALHRQGLRAGGYIGASLFTETFFAEEPSAREWEQIDETGAPVRYLDPAQSFRIMACRNNPGYQAFLEKTMRMGVERMKFDLIHFDQMESWTEPHVCRCRHCAAQFREFIKAKYSAADLKARYGFTRLDDVQPPLFGPFVAAGRAEIINPLMQDWVEFRAASYARRYGEYDRFLARLNPQVALEGNPNVDMAINKATRNAFDPGRLLEHGDIVWSEEPQQASWTADERLVSKIRSYKLVRRMGKSLFAYTGGRYGASAAESPSHLRLAEAMAYNDLNLGMVGDVSPEGVALTPEARRYIEFFHAHKAALRGARTVADVAVLRAFAAIEFNPAECLVGTTLFEQSLIQARVPFDIILDRHLDELDRYKVLVLADQDALGDRQIEKIRRFVERGGGLVATGRTSMLTDWRLRRTRFGLAPLLGIEHPAATPIRRESGKGRVVYIPRIEPAIAPPAPHINYRFDGKYWKLARNHAELLAAVDWAAGGTQPVRVEAPPSVAIELARSADGREAQLHLVNYDVRTPARNLKIALRLPAGMAAGEASAESPDGGARQALPVRTEGATAHLTLPRLEVYNLVRLRLAPR